MGSVLECSTYPKNILSRKIKMTQFTYLFVDIGCFIIPFLASFYPKAPFYKEWKYFIPANITIALFFLVWDNLFAEYKIWGFNPDYLIGFHFFNLPLEEILFFISIPYACVFTYYSLKYLIKENPLSPFQKKINQFLIVLLFSLAIIFFNRLYTSITFSLTAIFLTFCLFKKIDLSYVYLAYLIVMPFFFISNGILTGFFFEDSIVWYNNAENIGFRIFTIPIEDILYGFLLIALNIILYEHLKQTKKLSLKKAKTINKDAT